MINHLRTVLVAEDDRFLRRAAESGLQRHGFIVMTASDGEEALRIARQERPDLILLDVIMPKLQGFDVLRELKQNPITSSIPVVILSNLGEEQDAKSAIELGAVDYWVKANIGPTEIGKRVEALLTSDES
jgi:DNA-binding response OmpR family regulator